MSKLFEESNHINVEGQAIVNTITSYRLDSEEDLKEFQKVMANGVNIVLQVDIKGVRYVCIQKAEPSKIAMGGGEHQRRPKKK